MRNLLFFLCIVCISIISIWYICHEDDRKKHPLPGEGTIVKMDMEESGKSKQREIWFDLMHRRDESDDWKVMEYKNAMNKVLRFGHRSSSFEKSSDLLVSISDQLEGRWHEKGSRNQAGSVLVTEYDVESDMIYLVSAGGSLFKGPRSGDQWEIINQDHRFSNEYLNLVELDGKKRLQAAIDQVPHYSDDDGKSWIKSEGINVQEGASTRFPVFLNDSSRTILLVHRPGWWEDLYVYESTDMGESFNSILRIYTTSMNNVALCRINGTDDVFLIEQLAENRSRLYQYNHETGLMDVLSSNITHAFGESGRANLTGAMIKDTIQLFSYDGNDQLFRSKDLGESWEYLSDLPVTPWRVGLWISPSDPNNMLIGAVECYRSINQGKIWYLLNNWWEYYDQIETKLHADIMYLNEFVDPNGNPFILNSNHGGLNISYDASESYQNIGLDNLNVSQYYSVLSHPLEPNFIFAGSQDQGLQRSFAENQQIATFEQVISGDYGHNTFTGNDQHFWTVYPFGWVTFYLDPFSSGYVASWEVESEDESVWIPPIVASPYPEEDVVYMAGGNINGGPGSHLIRLEYFAGQIESSQFDFDFKESDGELSAIAFSPFDPQTIYTGTTTGAFYKSVDGGLSFSRAAVNVPGGHYLYGASILPSSIDPQVVYYAGSGYSNAPVLKSEDGGMSFYELSDGLPPTLIFDLAATPDEQFIFAGSESGAYVYLASEDLWYDLSQTSAPNQSYWSVEYLDAIQTVRFGTYGRGIWDFEIEDITIPTFDISVDFEKVHIYPNLIQQDYITIDVLSDDNQPFNLFLSDLNGRILFSDNYQNLRQTVVNLPGLTPGMYILNIQQGERYFSQKIIKL